MSDPVKYEWGFEVYEVDFADGDECDGCGLTYLRGTKMITGIISCCGDGCRRVLCARCVDRALTMLANVGGLRKK